MSHKGDEWMLCLPYLPKPKRIHKGLIASCSDCNKLFVGRMGYEHVRWRPLEDDNDIA